MCLVEVSTSYPELYRASQANQSSRNQTIPPALMLSSVVLSAGREESQACGLMCHACSPRNEH